MADENPQTSVKTPETLETNVENHDTDAIQLASSTKVQENNGQETVSSSNKKTGTEKENLKYEYAKSNEYKGETFLNVELAKIDEDIDAKTRFNNEFEMKIECFFIPKHNEGAEFCNKEHIIRLPYSQQVRNIVMEDSLDTIGMKCNVELSDVGAALEHVFARPNNYYFVINFTEYVTGGSIKYEPYIFAVSSVTTISKGYKQEKRIVMHLVDIMTSILQSHSIASFIKSEGTEVTRCNNYKVLLSKVIDYVKRFIKISTNNYFEFKKDVLFDQNTYFSGNQKLNGYDVDLNLENLIAATFNKIDRNASIWEALSQILRDCVTSIKISNEIKEQFENIGDVLIPFFFKEEYSFLFRVDQAKGAGFGANLYYTLWNNGNEKLISSDEEFDEEVNVTVSNTSSDDDSATLETNMSKDKVTVTSIKKSKNPSETISSENAIQMKDVALPNYGGKSFILGLRNITMRDFFMPFYLCFSYNINGGPFIYEDINDGKIAMIPMNGKHIDNLQSLSFHSIHKNEIDKRWKNVIFLSTNGSGVESTLIFFDWFYKFFSKVFLNSFGDGVNSRYISNVIPDFYHYSLTNGVGQASDAKTNTFDNLYDEYNSYTVALTTKDTVNEALREMGKNLASLVLLNDTYKLTLKGNLLRRPNEIIRLNIGDLFDGSDKMLPLCGDGSMFVYIRQVTHVFQGETYINNIEASKICESI